MDENEILDVVDENDLVLRSAHREEVYAKKLKHRIVHILLFNSKGQLGLQKRSMNKSFLPGFWVTSAGGHVKTGESYEQAALRELTEELEVSLPLEFNSKLYFLDESRNLGKFLGVFKAWLDTEDLTVNNEEVDSISFTDIDEVKRMVDENVKIHPELSFIIRQLYNSGN